MITLTPEQLHILQHSLGCDKHGRGTNGWPHEDEGDGCFGYHRNHYASDSTPLLESLVADGMMRDGGMVNAWGGMRYYRVTLAGRDAMLTQSPKRPKLTRSQQRYRQWRAEDGGETFREWLLRNEHNRKVDRRESAYV